MATRPSAARLATERENAAYWAKLLLDNPNDWVILDTETTGLHRDGEICQLGVLAPDGAVLFDELIRPVHPIPEDATKIHGISNAMVADCYGYNVYHAALQDCFDTRNVIIFNGAYDTRILRQTAALYKLPTPISGAGGQWECAMLKYARFVGDWNDYRGDFRWPKLPARAGAAHAAIEDCRSTLAIIKEMAEAASVHQRAFVLDV